MRITTSPRSLRKYCAGRPARDDVAPPDGAALTRPPTGPDHLHGAAHAALDDTSPSGIRERACAGIILIPEPARPIIAALRRTTVRPAPGGLVLMPSALGIPHVHIRASTSTRTTVRYRARGVGTLWTAGTRPAGGAVVKLLGRARAEQLEALRSPATGTDLAGLRAWLAFVELEDRRYGSRTRNLPAP